MMNNPFELAQYVGTLLSRKKLKLVTIESCTGGSLAKQITDVPGASEWFDCGLITYSNESKTKLAGVPDDLIRQQGAVSQKVALAMAKGAINVTGSDIALYLARHGINVEVLPPQKSKRIGDALLAFARQHSTDLLVMGGYGHTRFREFLLGGVTRTVLAESDIPILMSH